MDIALAALTGFEFLLLSIFISTASALIFRPRPPRVQNQGAQQFDENSLPRSKQGERAGVIFGRIRVRALNTLAYKLGGSRAIIERAGGRDQTVGYNYFIKIVLAIGLGPLTLHRVWMEEKELPSFAETRAQGYLPGINSTHFWGGRGRGGGLYGNLYFQPGNDIQAVNPAYEEIIVNQHIVPAFDNLATLTLTSTDESRGFLLGETPTLRPVSAEVSRYPTSLASSYSRIPIVITREESIADPTRPAWRSQQRYNAGAEVSHDNAFWRASRSGAPRGLEPGTSTAAWRSTRAPTGGGMGRPPDVPLWDSSRTYATGSRVRIWIATGRHQGEVVSQLRYFIANRLTQGETPGSPLAGGWTQFTLAPGGGVNEYMVALGDDANPAHCIYEILTNPDWGLGVPTSQIDRNSFIAAARTLHRERRGMSDFWNVETTAQDYIRAILDNIANGILYRDRITGAYTLRLIRDDYNLARATVLDPDNINAIKFGIVNVLEPANQVRITFQDRDNNYEESVAVAQDQSAFEQAEPLRSIDHRYRQVSNSTLANKLADDVLRVSIIPRITTDITILQSVYDASPINPGDVVLLNYPQLHVSGAAMRVVNVSFGNQQDGKITLRCLQDIFSTDETIFDSVTGDINPVVPEIEVVPDPDPATFLEMPRFLVRKMIATGLARGFNANDSYIQHTVGLANPPDLSLDIEVTVNDDETLNDSAEESLTPFGIISDVGNVNSARPRSFADADDVRLIVSNISDISRIVPHSVTEVSQRNGDRLLLIGDELLTYSRLIVDRTDVIIYGVKRELMDTARRPISIGDRVLFLNDLPVSDRGARNYEGNETLAVTYTIETGSDEIITNAPTTVTRQLQARPQHLAAPKNLLVNDVATTTTGTYQGDVSSPDTTATVHFNFHPAHAGEPNPPSPLQFAWEGSTISSAFDVVFEWTVDGGATQTFRSNDSSNFRQVDFGAFGHIVLEVYFRANLAVFGGEIESWQRARYEFNLVDSS